MVKKVVKEAAVGAASRVIEKPFADVKERLDQAGEQVKERLDQAGEAASELVHETKRVLQRELRTGRERAEDLFYEVEHQIRRHPIRSVTIALGAGMLFGWALGRVLSERS